MPENHNKEGEIMKGSRKEKNWEREWKKGDEWKEGKREDGLGERK